MIIFGAFPFQIETAKREHQQSLDTKSRLERMLTDKDTFVNNLVQNRADIFAVCIP